MLFSEVYGTYYNVLARLLTQAVNSELTKASMYAVVQETGFEESILTIPDAMMRQSWPLIKKDFTTPLMHKPTMPLTTLQKRWLKSLLSDPRIRLFDPPGEGLEDVQPLYPPGAFVYYDRYTDGDPFEDPGYIQRFRCILTALRERRRLQIHFDAPKGPSFHWQCIPRKLEYSPKDDKFRLICTRKRNTVSVNLTRIRQCSLLEPFDPEAHPCKPLRKQSLVLELKDERSALERAMLHFSHLEKETERIGEDRYTLTLRYEQEDETELLIRVLSFGPMLKVISPEAFKEQLLQRLEKQKNLRTRE